MAIIRLDCNLNGGDSVTPNNELFYRIYGDVDSYTAPIWTTGTALSDANVTVNNDNVIITGVDGTTNTSFKIAAVDEAGNEGILSNASTSISILFEDKFEGTTIDTNKWVISPNPNLLNTQNDNLILTDDSTLNDPETVVIHSTATKWEYDNTGKDMVVIIKHDASGITNTDSPATIGLTDVPAENKCTLNKEPGLTTMRALVMNSTVATVTSLTETWSGTWKMVMSGGTVNYYIWEGSAWSSSVHTDVYTEVTDNTLYIQRNRYFTTGDVWLINRIQVLDTDITTEFLD